MNWFELNAMQWKVLSEDGGIGFNNPPVNRVEEVKVANQKKNPNRNIASARK